MTIIVEHPVEITFVDAMEKYDGNYTGMRVTERDEYGDPAKVRVFVYTDKVDEKFVDALNDFDINFTMKADRNFRFPDRTVGLDDESSTTIIVEEPVETTFEEAVKKYNGKYLGAQITDSDESCIYKVIVKLVCDGVPDDKFVNLMGRLGVNYMGRANYADMRFFTREELGR